MKASLPFLAHRPVVVCHLSWPGVSDRAARICGSGEHPSPRRSLAPDCPMPVCSHARRFQIDVQGLMSRDQIQKQPRVRASLLVCTRRCHTLIHTHTQNVARTQTHTRTPARTCARTNTHDYTISNRSVSLSPPPEKCSRYHPRTALVPFLSSQRPFPVPLGYPQKMALKGVRQVKRIRKFFSH